MRSSISFAIGASLLLAFFSAACRPKAVPVEPTPWQKPANVGEGAGEGEAAAPEIPVEEVQFNAIDGTVVFADLHRANADLEAPLIILFHQAGGSARGEYAEIVPRLLEAGYHVLAVDLRSGGDRFGIDNRTAAGVHGEVGYCDAYPDLEVALAYVKTTDFTGPRVIWGSSYSAGLVFKLAAEHPESVAAVLAFSPASGEAMEGCRPEASLSRLKVPTLALRPINEAEMEAVQAQTAEFEAAGVQFFVADPGTHGSSMLVEERAGGDPSATWEAVMSFLTSTVPSSPPATSSP